MNTNSKNSIPVCILAGPTGVGKTALISGYFSHNYEIINADATQVYKYLDIGSAKPSPALQKKIPHHLIDIADPDTQFSVADFVAAADETAVKIAEKNHRTIVSGGTGFYIRNFISGLAAAPPPDHSIREALLHECRHVGLSGMYTRLQDIDPDSARRIKSNDEYRILRAIEVFQISGKPLSFYSVPDSPRSGYAFLTIGLQRERPDLVERIYRRVDLMFEQGLLDEIKNLIKMGYTEQSPGLRGIGYAEFFRMIAGCTTIRQVKEQIQLHSRQYAKRQMTFFRKLPGIQWFSPEEGEILQATVNKFFEQYSV